MFKLQNHMNQVLKSKLPTILLAILLLTIIGGMDLFHNHQPSFYGHEDCPVYHLNMLLSAALITFILFLTFLRQYIVLQSIFQFFQFVLSHLNLFSGLDQFDDHCKVNFVHRQFLLSTRSSPNALLNKFLFQKRHTTNRIFCLKIPR